MPRKETNGFSFSLSRNFGMENKLKWRRKSEGLCSVSFIVSKCKVSFRRRLVKFTRKLWMCLGVLECEKEKGSNVIHIPRV